MATMDRYRPVGAPLPGRMLRWHLYGQGIENLRVEEVDVPAFGPDQLLVRQDACGLCFSDIKVIGLGPDHPRMAGRDLATDPVTLGHEVACTVVGVGAQLEGRFTPGDRFIVQADVFYKGVSMAYGYVIRGGLAEYSVIPIEMIDGDAGCYLLPIRPDAGYAATALVEPWACVVSAYNQSHRGGIKGGGAMLVLCGPDAADVDLTGLVTDTKAPATVTLLGAASLPGLPSGETLPTPSDAAGWQALKAARAAGGFDDIVVLGTVQPELIEAAAALLADHGIMNVAGGEPLPRPLTLDIGRVHYNWHHYVGVQDGPALNAYALPRKAELKAGGAAWFIGAGGPMGQMHVQRAVFHRNPPRLIVASDIDDERLATLKDRFANAAKAAGIDLRILNPRALTPAEYDSALHEATDGAGFDDVVSLVPVPALIQHAAGFVAAGGWFNVFAGVARGTMAQIDVNAIKQRGVRYVGSSGSALEDMQETLARVESGELSTNASLAAVGGMCAAAEGMQAVKDARFSGKTLVFPLLHRLPLMPLDALKDRYPSVYARLDDGRFWTQAAEDELLRVAFAEEDQP